MQPGYVSMIDTIAYVVLLRCGLDDCGQWRLERDCYRLSQTDTLQLSHIQHLRLSVTGGSRIDEMASKSAVK